MRLSSALAMAVLTAATLFAMSPMARGAPPVLYSNPAYESPVRGAPDDLLMLAGSGFAPDDTVIYRAVDDIGTPAGAPPRPPLRSTPNSGVAPVVGSTNASAALTVHLPAIMRADQTYRLWVRNARGESSRPLLINDARPFWFTPAAVYATASEPALPRELKIVGRNLQSARGRALHIRLTGPARFTGEPIVDETDTDVLRQYMVRLALPPTLTPGRYRVEVSRDGVNWSQIPEQHLEVLEDPAPLTEFSVSDPRFGGCRPDDGADDTACILRAITAAASAGGGEVRFAAGTWNLIDSMQAGISGDEGIVVPPRVHLRGAGSAITRLDRHAVWVDRAPAAAALTLLGGNRVSGFTFRDLKHYRAHDRAGPFLMLGRFFDKAGAGLSRSVNSVAISDNVFDKTMVAIGSGGLPMQGIVIAHNKFGAFHEALQLGGNQYNITEKFRIDDSIIAHNTFDPGSELDLPGQTGSLASELGAGRRVDFSGNTADGASKEFLYSPDDAPGWRAAFFWNLNGSVEQVLISQNVMTCTGDKIGDGEAISLDNNTNTFAFEAAATATRAGNASISVTQRMAALQNGRDIPMADYYVDHWIQIIAGPGLGQVRKIVAYSTDALTHETTFRVSPAWDVVPAPGTSRLAVGREFWQLYAIDNEVDNRKLPCLKSNRNRQNAGVITLWAQNADSVIAGNRQYDSAGIFVQQNYVTPEHPCANCTMQSFITSFLDIRDNLIDGEYDWSNDCSTSGIGIGAASAPWGGTPPTVGFGVNIAHNEIRHADGQYGGAIAQLNTWQAGPEPHRWPLSDNLLIQHNGIADIAGSRAMAICGKSQPRMGIAFPSDPIAWHTVLYANKCRDVDTPLGSGGVDSIAVCPSHTQSPSCECGAGEQR